MRKRYLLSRTLMIMAVFTLTLGLGIGLLPNLTANIKSVNAVTRDQQSHFEYEINGSEVTITGVTAAVKSESGVELIIPSTFVIDETTYPVTNIRAEAFKNWAGLTSVIIPENVTSIGSQAFYNCTALTNISIPSSITSIGNYAFYGTTYLTKIDFNAVAMNDLASSNYVFYNSGKSGTGITVNVGADVTKIPAYMFFPYSSSSYSPKITAVNFAQESACTTIGMYAFGNLTSLTEIAIPESITSIGNYAFYGTTYLTKIDFNAAAVNDLIANNYVFHNAGKNGTGITVNIGEEVTKIPAYMFFPYSSSSYSPKITAVNFAPEGVCATIGMYAFGYCVNLTEITIPESVTDLGTYAFLGCTGLTSVTLPSSIASIGNYTFYNCTGLTSITIPSSVTSIGNYAFYSCTGLTGITIPSSVTTINTYAFYNCISLQSLTIPSTVTSLGTYAFQNCTGLTSLVIEPGLTSISSYAFSGCNRLTSVTIASSVTSIATYAFYNCFGLNSIFIPKSVTSIGACAFAYCYGLTEITVDPANTVYRSEENCIIQRSNNSLIQGCRTSVIPSSVRSIASYAFYYSTTLTNIEFALPSNVESIGSYAFQDCIGLTSIEIPSSVTTINTYAFRNCTSLASVNLSSNLTTIGNYAFYNCTSLNNVAIPSKITTISSYAFGFCTSLTNITIPSSVTSIGSYAFQNCTSLANLTIPESVTVINTYAFYNCSGLTSIKIPSGVTVISNYTFYGCTRLASITIPDNITSIGTNAFYNCTSLTNIRIPNKVTTIGANAFYGCLNLTSTAIPASVLNIGSNAFYNCNSLTIYIEIDATAIPSTWVAGWNSSSRPIIDNFSGNVTLTLNYNHATAPTNGSKTVEFNTTYSIDVPARDYYRFVGWFSESTGGIQYTDASGASLNVWSEPANRTIYAIWEWIPVYYDITNSIVTKDDDIEQLTAKTTFEVIGGNGIATDTIVLNQTGYLSVYFNTEDYQSESFTTWMVKRNVGTDSWDNLGPGISVAGTLGRSAEQKLDLFNNGSYLINEDFLDKYVQSDGKIIFKAIYSADQPNVVTIDAGQVARTYGTVEVDGIQMLFGQDGKILVNYAESYDEDMILKVIPKNKYRVVEAVKISTDGISWEPVAGNENEYTIQVAVGLRIFITYTSLTYDISVVAKTTRDEDVPGTAVNSPNGTIGLEAPDNVFNDASLIRNLTGYRLVSNSINNVKIFNNLKNRFEYFSAINGNVNLLIDEVFLDKFLDQNGKVTVIAIYVKQYEIDIDIENAHLGKVLVTVEEPNGNYYEDLNARYFDEGSIITITAVADDGSSISSTTGIQTSEKIYEDYFVLVLNSDRTISIKFDVLKYTLNVNAIDMNDDFIESIDVNTTETSLNFNAEFTVTADSSPDYQFIGWYARVGNEYFLLSENEGSYTNELNESFEDFIDGHEVNILARFAKIYYLEISGTTGGSWAEPVIIVGGKLSDSENIYKENTIVKITFALDNSHYFLSGIDGLYASETIISNYVIITINGHREISFNFAPVRLDIESNDNLSNGKINLLTNKIALNEKVVITFDVSSGYEVSSWTINGLTIAQINAGYAGANASQNGNTVTFTVTAGWLNEFGSRLDNTVTTKMNSDFLMILIAALVLIPLLVLGILLMLRANKKRKADYAKAMTIRDQKTKGLNIASTVSQLREGNTKTDSSNEKK